MDPSSYSQYGNTTYHNQGNSWNRYGNTTYGSNGRSCSQYGNSLYRNSQRYSANFRVAWNIDYIPRDEKPSGSTGGKRVYVDNVIWRYIPDPFDAADDLVAGKVHWWEDPPLDFIPKIEQNPDLQTLLVDPLGTQGWLRPNFLHPPFNNKKAREALVHMMDQVTYLAWSIGQSQYYRPCYSVFACGSPYATRIGAEPMMEHDLTRARELVKESGYDGQPIVVLHVTDRASMNAAAIVTRQRLESIGFKVILKGMDWSTNLVARTRKEPPGKGGWNLLHTWWQAADVGNPAVHSQPFCSKVMSVY